MENPSDRSPPHFLFTVCEHPQLKHEGLGEPGTLLSGDTGQGPAVSGSVPAKGPEQAAPGGAGSRLGWPGLWAQRWG